MKKYYYAGSQRVAMRENNVLSYIIGDHLGSTSIVTDASGNVIAQQKYKAWGEVRYESGTNPSEYSYTGQYSYTDDFGLMFYNARWYDSYLNHFTQPDSIVPDPTNPQDWDRYAYAQNNPLRYTDPTGHAYCDYTNSQNAEDCNGGQWQNSTSKGFAKGYIRSFLKDRYDWDVASDFSEDELKAIRQTGRDIETYANSQTGGNGLDWMQSAFGGTSIVHSQYSTGQSFAWPWVGGALIQLDQNWMTDSWGANVVFAHELGHVWDINSGFTNSGEMNSDLGGSSPIWCFFCSPGGDVPQWDSSYHTVANNQAYGNTGRNEYFAEAFAATIYPPLNLSYVPSGVASWINLQISIDTVNYLFPGGLR